MGRKNLTCKSIQRVQEEVAQLLRPLRPTPGEKQLRGAYEATGLGTGKGGAASIHPWEVQRFFHTQKKRRVGHFVGLKIYLLEMGWKFGIISR